MKAASQHQKLRQPRDGRCDTTRFVGRKMAVAERPFLQVVAAMNGEPEAVGVAHFEAVRAGLFDPPGRRESAFVFA